MPRLTQSVAFIIALLVMIFTLLLAPVGARPFQGVTLDASTHPTPTPECSFLEDGTWVCVSGVSATAVPATPTVQPSSPLFPVVWLPIISK
jgi:hypothetical protein